MTKKKRYTSSGVEINDELLDRLADEAERGFDLSRLRPRPGRPPMGDEAAIVFQVRLDPDLRKALFDRAKKQKTTPSEIARRLLRAGLGIK